uniref:Uncharacterized protein n=1 Tax=viral metagenome TaxID=1070528 RepID=A0A6C0H0E5_9ZZZZ
MLVITTKLKMLNNKYLIKLFLEQYKFLIIKKLF